MSDYYHLHPEAYHEATFHIDPASFLRPLAERLPPGALILDVGCGSGRDLGWLRHRGFRAVGLERSPGLARLARENAACEILEADFTVFDFSSLRVDGILLVGAFVHVLHGELPALLSRCTAALEPGGLVAVTCFCTHSRLRFRNMRVGWTALPRPMSLLSICHSLEWDVP